MRNDISNIILQEISVFFDMMLSFNQVIFWVFVSIRNCFMCFFSVLDVMNIFESLVVLNIELNHTVELMGLAYSQEFDNIFALSCWELKEMSHSDAKFHDRAWDEYEIVSMAEMRMGWVAMYKVFWQFDNFFGANRH